MDEPTVSGQFVAMLRSHVERVLQEKWERSDLVVDGDGDYPFRWGTAACWVSILDGPEAGVRVFAYAAQGLRRSAKLLAEVNDLTSRAKWARLLLNESGTLVVSDELHWTLVNSDSLGRLMDGVGFVADDVGTMVATVFGGETPFSAEPDSEDEEAA